jgi:hypothetical protein
MDELEEFSKSLDKMSNNKLCEIIVANRYLGILRDIAILCMEELAKRRLNGDSFLYEQHIEQILSTLPKINLDLNQIMKKMPKII